MNRIETFMSELVDLMEKYRVEIDVNMVSARYNGDMFDCIEFTSEPDWDNEEEPRYQEFEMGSSSFDYEDIRNQLQGVCRDDDRL